MAAKLALDLKPVVLPNLNWAIGIVHEILIQPGEMFYAFVVQPANGAGVVVRIADPHTGTPLAGVTTANLIFDTMKEAYFRKLNVQVGYRDFGQDPQAGINKLVIDRVILTQ